MDKSIFTDKNRTPCDTDLKEALRNTYTLWLDIREHVHHHFPSAIEEWNYSGDKYGWGFRIKDKKRVIIYLLPRDRFFKTAFVFGQKATEEILKSKIHQEIIDELKSAKPYAEGRGIRIAINDKSLVNDIKKLIDIKLKN